MTFKKKERPSQDELKEILTDPSKMEEIDTIEEKTLEVEPEIPNPQPLPIQQAADPIPVLPTKEVEPEVPEEYLQMMRDTESLQNDGRFRYELLSTINKTNLLIAGLIDTLKKNPMFTEDEEEEDD